MRLAALFTDHAILQREKPLPVWGWTSSHYRVQVTLGTAVAETISDANGKFLLYLAPQKAGGPYVLTALAWSPGTDKTVSQEKITVKDVYIGEVWLASGQSNMEMAIYASGWEGKASAISPLVRMITVPNQAKAVRQLNFQGKWEIATASTVQDFSAAAYHFAARLQSELQVPVGIIHSSWGGTIVEAWISANTLSQNPDMKTWLKSYHSNLYSPELWQDLDSELTSELSHQEYLYKKYCPVDQPNMGFDLGYANCDFNDSEWQNMTLPGAWTKQGYATNGTFWFRKTIEISAADSGKSLILELGAIDKTDITYFNGQQVGATGQGYDTSVWNKNRVYEIPGELVKEGKNVIAVRAYSFLYDGGMIGPKIRAKSPGSGTVIDLSGDWKFVIESDFGGLVAAIIPTLGAGPGNPNTLHILFDSKIYPLIPYALRGAIWYQGESNAERYSTYKQSMIDLARDWQYHWGQGEFPLIQVQLANFRPESDYNDHESWPYLREAQLQACGQAGIGMISAIDIGEAADIHPHNKLDVGRRLAGYALKNTYNRPEFADHGPHYRNFEIENSRIRIYFDGCQRGLDIRPGSDINLKTFYIAGVDRKFVPAQAVIEGDSVVVWNDSIEQPAAVRYAWSDNPAKANLCNGHGLPASSFRTDNW